MSDGAARDLLVFRCATCGDTFPSDDDSPVCPTCGGTEVGPASEPLL